MLGANGFLGSDRRSRGSRLEAGSLSYKAEIVAGRWDGSPGSEHPMAPRKHEPGPPKDARQYVRCLACFT